MSPAPRSPCSLARESPVLRAELRARPGRGLPPARQAQETEDAASLQQNPGGSGGAALGNGLARLA